MTPSLTLTATRHTPHATRHTLRARHTPHATRHTLQPTRRELHTRYTPTQRLTTQHPTSPRCVLDMAMTCAASTPGRSAGLELPLLLYGLLFHISPDPISITAAEHERPAGADEAQSDDERQPNKACTALNHHSCMRSQL